MGHARGAVVLVGPNEPAGSLLAVSAPQYRMVLPATHPPPARLAVGEAGRTSAGSLRALLALSPPYSSGGARGHRSRKRRGFQRRSIVVDWRSRQYVRCARANCAVAWRQRWPVCSFRHGLIAPYPYTSLTKRPAGPYARRAQRKGALVRRTVAPRSLGELSPQRPLRGQIFSRFRPAIWNGCKPPN